VGTVVARTSLNGVTWCLESNFTWMQLNIDSAKLQWIAANSELVTPGITLDTARMLWHWSETFILHAANDQSSRATEKCGSVLHDSKVRGK